RGAGAEVAQERRLPDARLAAQDQHSAAPLPYVVDHSVEGFALGAASSQFRLGSTVVHAPPRATYEPVIDGTAVRATSARKTAAPIGRRASASRLEHEQRDHALGGLLV